MMLQALYKLAEQERLVPDPDFEEKPVAWLLRIGKDGKLLGPPESTKTIPPSEELRKKPKARAKSLRVPREAGRTSGDAAFFLFDKAEYVLRRDPTGAREPEKLAARFDLFRQKVRDCADATRDEGVKAVTAFLDDIASGKQSVQLPEDCASNDLFAFIYAPDVDQLVTDREKVRQYWKQLRSNMGDRAAMTERCLVSGKVCSPVDKLPPIKNLPGGSSSGVALVSYNSGAFESYGWKRNKNAPISREAGEFCMTALNRLLHPAWPDPDNPGQTLPRRRLFLSDNTVVCYWAAEPSARDFVDCFAGIWEGNPDAVRMAYRSLWNGRSPTIEDASPFYALVLSGAQGRATVRTWFESTVKEVVGNLALHFADLGIVRNTPQGDDQRALLSLGSLLESLAPLGNRKDIPPAMAAQFMEAAMHGTPYPFSILQRAVERARAEVGKDEWKDLERRDARAALLKGVLNRRKRFYPETTTHYKEVTENMDRTNTNPGYLFGRLMALLERMQQVALNDLNASVVDRYFSGASATPRVVFPRLLKNLRHHARKAQDDERSGKTARWLESQVDDVLKGVREFPPSLDLEQQALFVLGYHHQRHWLWMGKEERKELETASTTA